MSSSNSPSSDSPSPPSDSPPPPSDSPSPPSDSSPPPSDSPPPPSDSPSPPSDSNPPSDSKSPPPPSDSSPPSGSKSPTTPDKSPSPPSKDDSPPSDGDDNNNNNNSNNKNNSGRSPSTPTAPSPPSRSSGSSTPNSRALGPPNSSNDNSSGSNSTAIIAGVALGAGLLLLIAILLLVSCCRRKRRKPHDQMKYYGGSRGGHGDKNNDYYNNNGPPGNWHHGPPTDHMMQMPAPVGAMGINSEQSWAVPPPPPMNNNSSDMSSAGFSGHALPPPHPAMALGFNQSSFTYDDLMAATSGFSKENLLGQGGFGYVHKGVLPNGKEIAVKSLKANSGQGEREFQAEVDIISRVHHRHLVSLVGYCSAGSKRLLVYEFVPNGTLEYHLHGAADCPTMDWPTRLKIALGSAKGFAYLHEDCHPRIIHRDIKAANILLDSNFEAKVADFGLAKLSSDTNTHVSTRIMGTFGYLAPEYASSGKLSEKSDVYSFGIMLLELITGRRPIDIHSEFDDDGLVDWARPILINFSEGGSYEELVDPRLENNYDPQEMIRMVASAAACIRHSAKRRPKMSKIVRALEGDASLDDLNEGVRPGHSTSTLSSNGSEHDFRRFRKSDLSSQEFTSSSEHGAMTGEH